nr:hypothetical protein [Tanacetum cinerariifolium]
AARRWLEKEPPPSITTWDDLVSKFIIEFFPPSRTTNLRNEISNFQQKFDKSFHEAWERYKDLLRTCPHHDFTELHPLDTFYNALNPTDQDSLNATAGGNLLEKSPQDALTIIEKKSKVRNSQSKPIASPVNACDINSSSEIAKLTHAVNQKTSAVTTAMMAMLKQLQANSPPAQVKAVEEICVTCGGAHSYYQCLAVGGNTFLEFRDNIHGYVSAAAGNYDQGSGSLSGNTVTNPKGELKAITTRSGLVTNGPTQEKDEIQIQKFWHMFKQLHLNITLVEALVLRPKYQKMLKALLFNKEKLQELANTPLNENCSAVILKKLPEKLGDPGKFLIPCGFSELKCKALADLGASINLMPLSVWKKLGLPDLIPTRMTLELVNRAICTPDGIARDVFILVGKFTFPADFIVVDYESDPRVPLILGRPFLRTARALIDVHSKEMILRDRDERLTLNMKHDTASYSNHPHRESANLINIFNVSSEDCLEDSVSNQKSSNPTFSLHKEITSLEVTHEIHDSEGCNFLSKELPDIDSFNDIHLHFDDNPLSGSTTYSSNSLLEEFTDELALITYPLDYDDNLKCDIKFDLRQIEFLLYQGEDSDLKDSIDQMDLANLDDYFVDPTPEMFTDEHAPDYSFPPRFDVYPDDFLEIESDADNFYDDPFDFKWEKIKEFELLIDELDLPCDILPYSEYDSFASQDFSRDDDFPSPDNEDKVFNPGILIHKKSVTIITRVAQEKKLTISYASLVFEDFDPLFYEPIVFKDVPNSMRLLLFSSENEEKVFKPGIYTSEKSFLLESFQIAQLYSLRLLSDIAIYQGLASDEDKSSRISKLQELDYFKKMHSLDLMQKARVKWKVKGDENSKFFHGLINSRRKSQSIHGIMHEGVWLSDPKDIKEAFLNFYKKKFSCHNSQVSFPSFMHAHCLNTSDQDLLEVVVSIEEIKTAVWDCGSNKAPGPDGYSFLFIKRFWDLLKHDIQEFVVSFFSSGKFPQGRQILDGPLILNEIIDWTSILINGSPTLEFSLKRDLRQGDPLSPFLFIIVIEGLHMALNDGIASNMFQRVRIGSNIHLFYADDVIILSDWNQNDVENITRILNIFYIAFGLKINFHKSNVFGVGVSNSEVVSMAAYTGCEAGCFPFSYLGLPIGFNMSRIANWQILIDRFKATLSGWKANILSIGGRLTLIKSVLGSLGIYYLSIFKAPEMVIKSLESLRANFFWGSHESSKKLSWVKWSNTLASFDKGGLGVGSLSAFNKALLLK